MFRMRNSYSRYQLLVRVCESVCECVSVCVCGYDRSMNGHLSATRLALTAHEGSAGFCNLTPLNSAKHSNRMCPNNVNSQDS